MSSLVFPVATSSMQKNQQGAIQEVLFFSSTSYLATKEVKFNPLFQPGLVFFLTLAYYWTHKHAMIEHMVLKCSALVQVPQKILQDIKMYIAGKELGSVWKSFLERTTDTPFSACHIFAWYECQSTLNLYRRKHISKHQVSSYSLLLCLHSRPQMNFDFTRKMLCDDTLVRTFPKISVLAVAKFFLMTNITMSSPFGAQCQQIFLLC